MSVGLVRIIKLDRSRGISGSNKLIWLVGLKGLSSVKG